jgi:hypothetical protein
MSWALKETVAEENHDSWQMVRSFRFVAAPDNDEETVLMHGLKRHCSSREDEKKMKKNPRIELLRGRHGDPLDRHSREEVRRYSLMNPKTRQPLMRQKTTGTLSSSIFQTR